MRPSRRHAFGLMPCLARSLGLGGFAPARRGVFRASAAMNGNVFRQSGRARCLAISRAGDSVGGRFSRYGKTGLARWVSAVFLRRGKIFLEWEWSALAAGGGCPRRFYQDFLRGCGGAPGGRRGRAAFFNAADRGRLRRARFPDSDGNFPRKRGFEKLPALRRVGERLGGRWGRIPILSGELANGAARKSRTGSLEAQEGFFSR